MKRKEIIEMLEEVATASYATSGVMAISNMKTGEVVDVDLPTVFAVSRGIVAWVSELLEGNIEAEDTTRGNLETMLTAIGVSITRTLNDESDEER